MKKIIPLFSLLFVSCYQQECNCSDYRTGKFEFSQEINGVKETTIFERAEKIQVETYKGKTDTASVRWINDCEFILQKINPKNRAEKQAITMKILTTSENSYIFEYGIVGSDSKQRGTAKKIE